MKKFIQFLTISALICTPLWAGSVAAADFGRIVTMSGSVKVNGNRINPRYKIKAGDKIATGKRSHVNIVMADKSVLDLRSRSVFKLEKFSYNKKKPEKSKSVMNLVSGSFRYISGVVGRTNPDNAVVRMGTATAGIRGSAGKFSFDGVNAEVSIENGVMTMTFDNGQKVTVSRGQAAKSNTVTGSTNNIPFRGDRAYAAAQALAKNPNDATVLASLSPAEKAMAVVMLVSEAKALGATAANLATAMGSVTKANPKAANLIAKASTVVAPDGAVAKAMAQKVVAAAKAAGENTSDITVANTLANMSEQALDNVVVDDTLGGGEVAEPTDDDASPN